MYDPSLAEVLGAIIAVTGLGFSAWALIDDVCDLARVGRYGEVGGPRWIAASGHLSFNATMVLGWALFCGVLAIAIYLPDRPDAPAVDLAHYVAWLRLGFAACVLVGQVHQRAARLRLQRLPIAAWERMLTAMVSGLSTEDRTALMGRVLAATSAGREMGHLVGNALQAAVGLLSMLADDRHLTADQRADIEAALLGLEDAAERARALHVDIKGLEPQS